MGKYENLLQPIKTKNLSLKNRILFSPTAGYMATHDCYCNADTVAWVRNLARGGAAAVSIGTGIINEVPPFVTYCTRVWDDTCINGLNQTFDTIHMFGAKAGLELTPLHPDPDPFDVRDKKGKKQVELDPNEQSIDDIHLMIKQYADAAERVMKAGGDYVVFHGAHAQAPAAFFSCAINERHDEYGIDTFDNRCRFALEALDSIRQRCGNKIAIEYRISGSDMVEGAPDMDEMIEFAKRIEPYIDWLHVSRGQLAVHKLTPYVFPPIYFERGFNLGYAEEFKKNLSIPVSCVGGMNPEIASKALEEGRIDMVSFSRPLLADPQIPNKIKAGREDEIKPCIRCNNCIHRTHNAFLPIRCAINPVQGREAMINTYPHPMSSKKVAVVGGGIGGMAAAMYATDRGHTVTIYEKSDKLGGVLNMTAQSPMKTDLKKYLEWAIRMTNSNPKVKVLLNTEATPEKIKAENYDAVIVSVGANPLVPGFLRNNAKAVWVGDVEMHNVECGQNVIVAGGGMTGMECAVDLSNTGRNVKIIDMLPANQIGQGGTKMNIIALQEMLSKNGVDILPETKLTAVTDAGIEVERNGKTETLACDTLVLSLGVRPDADFVNSFMGCAPDVIAIGDCNARAGTVMNANHTAFDAAYSIL